MLVSEIRAWLAGLPEAKLKAALSTALVDGDDGVLGTVLNGPAMLSGVGSAEELEMVRQHWRSAGHGPRRRPDRAYRPGRWLSDSASA